VTLLLKSKFHSFLSSF